MSPRMATSRRDTKQFADFVRIHALDGNLITRDDEMRILKEGVTRFGMDLEEARGILLRAAAEHNITLLKADWTQYDPEITKRLASVGRSGVPTYVIYPASATGNADVLPELLTKDIVLTALQRVTKQ